ncbi:MAG: AI-2E family transporter [Bacillota bacterium]|nr:AI-2E family transporter [Bacillota bacterium]
MGFLAEQWQRHRRLLGAAFLLALLAAGLWRVRAILPPFLLAGVLSYLLNPLVTVLVQRGFSRPSALIFIYLTVILLGAVAIGLLIPVVIGELNRLAEFLPGYFAQLQAMSAEFQERYSQFQLPGALRQSLDDAILTVQGQLLGLIGSVGQSVLSVFTALFSLLLAPILSFYLLKDLDKLREGFRRLLPRRERSATVDLLGEIDAVISGFVRGQLTVAALVGLLMMAALALLKIRFAIILAIFAGITDVIPYFGPLIGAIPALAVAAASSPIDALKVLAAIFVIQQAESQILSPRIIGSHVGLHPLAVIFALLAGFELFGLVGMIAAVPVAGVLRVLIARWLSARDHVKPG